MTTILGIDPGTAQSAIVVWNGERITRASIVPNDQLRKEVLIPFGTDYYGCGVVACEHLQCFGMAVGQEVFETAYLIGAIRQICFDCGMSFRRVYRSDVKGYWCHSNRATDANIRQAVIDRLGAPGTKKAQGVTYGIKADLWSALAIAVRQWDIENNYETPAKTSPALSPAHA